MSEHFEAASPNTPEHASMLERRAICIVAAEDILGSETVQQLLSQNEGL